MPKVELTLIRPVCGVKKLLSLSFGAGSAIGVLRCRKVGGLHESPVPLILEEYVAYLITEAQLQVCVLSNIDACLVLTGCCKHVRVCILQSLLTGNVRACTNIMLQLQTGTQRTP